jgi:hypothetical protein
MKEFAWCLMYVKATILTENYEAAYKLWRKRNTNLRKTEANHKSYVSKNKILQTLKLMR